MLELLKKPSLLLLVSLLLTTFAYSLPWMRITGNAIPGSSPEIYEMFRVPLPPAFGPPITMSLRLWESPQVRKDCHAVYVEFVSRSVERIYRLIRCIGFNLLLVEGGVCVLCLVITRGKMRREVILILVLYLSGVCVLSALLGPAFSCDPSPGICITTVNSLAFGGLIGLAGLAIGIAAFIAYRRCESIGCYDN
jgi:hypothetical protein